MNQYLYYLTCGVVALLCVWATALISFDLPVYAQASTCIQNSLADSLITAGGGSIGGLGNQGQICFSGAPAYIPTLQATANIRADSYQDLYVHYYQQGKATKVVLTPNLGTNTYDLAPANKLSINNNGGTLYYVNGNLTVNPGGIDDTAGSRLGIFFVTGNLYLPGNLIYGETVPANPLAGLVFIVKGQINIGTSSVAVGATSQTIDAVLISEGTVSGANPHSICTACDINGTVITVDKIAGTYHPNLIVNGGAVSLSKSDNALELVRVPKDTRVPAETIKADPRYLVILKDTLTSAVKIWWEQ